MHLSCSWLYVTTFLSCTQTTSAGPASGTQEQVVLQPRDQLVGHPHPRLAQQVNDRSAELPVTTTAVQHPHHGHRSGSIPRRG
jgi:hypothetical protein